jgi:acyl-CoA reductase-like NAD-dependent aldehyde dehydrogenase
MAQILQEAGVPDGVINVVPSKDVEAGKVMMTHPDMVKLDLTGGTSTGHIIGEGAGKAVKHFTAELGGNAPVLVFEDAPGDTIDRAVNGVAFAAFVASGQTCVSAKRILVQRSVYDEFVAKLVAKVNGLQLLDPMDLNSHMGPVIHARSLGFITDQVNAAVQEGAKVLTGGRPASLERLGGDASLQAGHWYEPTILAVSGPENSAFQEEIFGPVITVQAFDTEEDAIALANDSKYGLGAAVWTRDVARAHRVCRKVRAGVMWVNAHHRNDPSTPWGGFKESGIGRENGWEAFREYTETQAIVVRTSDEPEDWFGSATARYS